MEVCLFGQDGYYSKAKVQFEGEDFHFNTAPELSPYFSEMTAKAIAEVWISMGRPKEFQIVEMGAGSGVWATSMLKEIRYEYPDLYQALKYVIVEYGDLIQRQQKRAQEDELSHKISWVQGSASELPLRHIKGAIISNELPDAFPVEKVRRLQGVIRQARINIVDNQWQTEWGEPDAEVASYIQRHQMEVTDQEVCINLRAEAWQRQIDQALDQGVILTFDYGITKETEQMGTTRFYGLENGSRIKSNDQLAQFRMPGQVDMTANIVFPHLKAAAETDGMKQEFIGYQRDFLMAFGLGEKIDRWIFEVMRNSNSWIKLLKMSNKFHSALLLMHSSFRCLALSKNIDLVWPQIPEENIFNVLEPRPVLKVATQPHQKLKLLDSEQRVLEAEIIADERGYVDFATILPGRTLIEVASGTSLVDANTNEVVLEFANVDAIKSVLHQSGLWLEDFAALLV